MKKSFTIALLAIAAGCSPIPESQLPEYVKGQTAVPDHALQVRPVAYQFAVNLQGRPLDQQDFQAVTDFLRSHGPLANQRLVVVDQGGLYEKKRIQGWFDRLGINRPQVRWVRQDAEQQRLLITTEYFVVRTPDCPSSDVQPGTPLHKQYRSPSFGCATAANLAMMVSDPRELVKGRNLAPASGTRLVGAVQRYQTNTVTPLLSTDGSNPVPLGLEQRGQ